MSLQKQRGLSLIEVMVTVLILSVSIMTLLQGITQGILILESAEMMSQAALLAKKKMAELSLKEFKLGLDTSGIFEENKKYSWKVEIKDPELEEAKSYSISQIDLFITWKAGDRKKEIKITTYSTKSKKIRD